MSGYDELIEAARSANCEGKAADNPRIFGREAPTEPLSRVGAPYRN